MRCSYCEKARYTLVNGVCWECQDYGATKEGVAMRLAAEYYEICEAYDRANCTGQIRRDGIMPASSIEQSQCNRNASETIKYIKHMAAMEGITYDNIRKAMHAYSRMVDPQALEQQEESR